LLSPEYVQMLDRGLQSEDVVAKYIAARHRHVVMRAVSAKSSTKQGDEAPMLLCPDVRLVLPDMLAWNAGVPLWVEVKDKDSCTWHRNSGRWQTGLEARLWRQYREVAARTRTDVCIWFVQHGRARHDDPPGLEQPRGVYTVRMSRVGPQQARERGGMVYLDMDVLKLQCSLAQLHAMANVTTMRGR
jgi:hypothetical protein